MSRSVCLGQGWQGDARPDQQGEDTGGNIVYCMFCTTNHSYLKLPCCLDKWSLMSANTYFKGPGLCCNSARPSQSKDPLTPPNDI